MIGGSRDAWRFDSGSSLVAEVRLELPVIDATRGNPGESSTQQPGFLVVVFSCAQVPFPLFTTSSVYKILFVQRGQDTTHHLVFT